MTAEPGGWRATLREMRTARGITQQELAQRIGVSVSAIRAYERGQRRPSAATLRLIVDGLGLPGEEANALLAAAYEEIARHAAAGQFGPVALDDLRTEIEGRRWPAFITNQSFDVVATNAAFERVFGVDLSTQYQGFGERNLFSGISHDEFGSRCKNWDEMAQFMIGLAKGDPRHQDDSERPLPWLEAPMKRFFAGNPSRIKRFLDLWEHAVPIPHRLRQTFRLLFAAPDGQVLTFEGVLSVADLATELHWNEWIPGDSATWAWLDAAAASADEE